MSPPPISPCGSPTGSTCVSVWSRSKETGCPLVPGTPLQVGAWSSAVALAQVALAHEIVGAARQMLDLARAHALGRIQFGQPISDFQAVRHRLADTLVAIEAAQPCWRPPGAISRPTRRPWPRRWPGGALAYRRAPLPAGAGRHRVHHRARLPPLRAARLRARPTLRHGPIPDQRISGPACWSPASSWPFPRCSAGSGTFDKRIDTGEIGAGIRLNQLVDDIFDGAKAKPPLVNCMDESSASGCRRVER